MIEKDFTNDVRELLKFLETNEEDAEVILDEETYAIISKKSDFVVKIFEHYQTGRETIIYNYDEFVEDIKTEVKEQPYCWICGCDVEDEQFNEDNYPLCSAKCNDEYWRMNGTNKPEIVFFDKKDDSVAVEIEYKGKTYQGVLK